MALISPQQVSDGVTSVNAAAVNNPINTIANDYNGNITNANIASGAAINSSKISFSDATVTSRALTNPVKFSVYRNAALTSNASLTVIPFDTKVFDTGTNIDVVTNKGRFTAPVAGFYWFCAGAGNTTATATQTIVTFTLNGTTNYNVVELILGGTNTGTVIQTSGLIQLAANDYIEVKFVGGAGSTMFASQSGCYFQGFLVSQT